MATDTTSSHDAEEWEALSREEQSAALDEGLERLRDKTEGEVRKWPPEKRVATEDAIERDHDRDRETTATDLPAAAQEMQRELQETWTAKVFEGVEDTTTLEFEIQELSQATKDELDEAGRLIAQLQATAEDEADIDDFDIESDHFDSIDELEEWIPEFLATVTAHEWYTEERWRSGEDIKAGIRELLIMEVYYHYDQEMQQAVEFRSES